MQPNRNVLTTGEVAKICNVAPRTVSKWFDAGQLRGYRIPGSKDRRIPLDHLVRFMRLHGMPLNGLDTGRKRLLVLDADTAITDAIRTALSSGDEYEVATAGSALEAGALAMELQPHVLIVDVSQPDASPQAVARFARSLGDAQGMILIGMARGLSEAGGHALLQEGFNAYLSKPFDTRTLLMRIEEATVAAAVADRPS